MTTDTSYRPERATPSAEQHADAKEVNDLVNALIDRNANIAKEAVEAVVALLDNVRDPDGRFLHLYKVLNAVLDNQLQARVMEKVPE